jgi:hypothetical protein
MGKIIAIVCGVLIILVGGIGAYFLLQPKSSTITDTRGSRAIATYPKNTPYEDRYEEGEILVTNPPEGFELGALELGFKVIERIQLRELSLSILRLSIPAKSNVKKARKVLTTKYPGINLDASHHFEAQALKDYKTKIPRAIIGWEKGTAKCGAGIRIGMIDAPVDMTHPALKGRKIEFKSFHRKDRRPGPADHGTAVAGMLVGIPSWGGLLPGAKLKAANMFEINKAGRVVGNAVALLKAINWMAKEKVHVVNLSVAGANNKVVKKAFDQARKKGLSMVAAAGNGGKSAKPAYPAAYKDVLAVTAFGAKRKIYSNANIGGYIDFAAPGVKIYTAVPGGGRLQSGTSFASPYIAVLVSLQTVRGKKSAGGLRKILKKSALDLGKPGKDEIFGWGMANMQPNCS